LPIDVIISPEIEVGEMVLRRIALPGAMDVMRFADNKIAMVAIQCLEDCPVINTRLAQLSQLFPDLPSIVVGSIAPESCSSRNPPTSFSWATSPMS
jgi:trk system potassium uptake protein TrkA